MLKSMTGYGRGELEQNSKKITIEMKSVNHRYCEVTVKTPRKLSFLENEVRNYVKQQLSRGKIDVYITYEDQSEGAENLKFNESLAREYMQYFSVMSETFGLKNDIQVSHLSRYPDVLIIEEQEENLDELWVLLKSVLDISIEKMISSRTMEGLAIRDDMIQKLDIMLSAIEIVKEKSPLVVAAYKARLTQRINEMLEKTVIDETRMAMEIALFADKTCIDEEIVRLSTHIEHMKQSLLSDQPIGRKLDFLSQEMNREANTILSKANAIEISNQALDLKTEIEKIREQIQNVE